MGLAWNNIPIPTAELGTATMPMGGWMVHRTPPLCPPDLLSFPPNLPCVQKLTRRGSIDRLQCPLASSWVNPKGSQAGDGREAAREGGGKRKAMALIPGPSLGGASAWPLPLMIGSAPAGQPFLPPSLHFTPSDSGGHWFCCF